MNIKDLIVGEVYWFKPYSSAYLMLHSGISNTPTVNTTRGSIFFGSGVKFQKASSNFSSKFETCRLATYEEKEWLLACIAANRLVEPFKINYYEIY